MRALSSVWTECLASDQVAAGSNPAVPITFCDGQHFADGSDPLIKDTPIGVIEGYLRRINLRLLVPKPSENPVIIIYIL